MKLVKLTHQVRGRLRCLYGRHEPGVLHGKAVGILFDEPVKFLPPCRYCGRPGGIVPLTKAREKP